MPQHGVFYFVLPDGLSSAVYNISPLISLVATNGRLGK